MNLSGEMIRLNLTEIKPEGWILDQLHIQMDGLTGKLYEIWDSVGSYSGWLGGSGENWERGPYYLDGLVPLAYYLKNKKQWELCCKFIEWTLGSQDEDGNFGPVTSKEDYWSRYVMLKVLIQFQEITGDKRVIPFCEKYCIYLNKKIRRKPAVEWSKARIPDLIYCVRWIFERTGNEILLELVDELEKQTLNWTDVFRNFPYTRSTAHYLNWDKVSLLRKNLLDEVFVYHETHIVNITMGLKYPAMQYSFHKDKKYLDIAKNAIDTLNKYHGVVSGAINGDEHLSGNLPTQGAELCSIVEYMFSLEILMETFGSAFFADTLERLAYNALPATITEDFMAHQYVQQANQVLVSKAKRNWFNNDDTANMFGLEPHFGCCTANMHQGWPKFVNSLWYKKGNDTLVSMVLAPNTVCTALEEEPVEIQLDTEYPFRDTLTYRIKKAPSKEIKIQIRIPGWCKEPKIISESGTVGREDEWIIISDRFHKGDEFQIVLPMEVRYSHWQGDSIAVERGPLVYGLDIKEEWRIFKEVAGIKDYEIFPGGRWNYSLLKNGEIRVIQNDVSKVPFSKKNPPVRLIANGKQCDERKIENDSAGPIPKSPVMNDHKTVPVDLIPFGCTKLRISEFPYYVRE